MRCMSLYFPVRDAFFVCLFYSTCTHITTFTYCVVYSQVTLVPLLLLAVFWIVVVMVTFVYPILHTYRYRLYTCVWGQNKTHTSRRVSTTKMTTHIIPMPMREQARESTINGHAKCFIGLQLKQVYTVLLWQKLLQPNVYMLYIRGLVITFGQSLTPSLSVWEFTLFQIMSIRAPVYLKLSGHDYNLN